LQIAIRKFQEIEVLKFNGTYWLLAYADDVNSSGKITPVNTYSIYTIIRIMV
jgi:hypothetical protein